MKRTHKKPDRDRKLYTVVFVISLDNYGIVMN